MISLDPDKKGFENLQKALASLGDGIPDAAAQGMIELAARILERATQRDLIPYDPGRKEGTHLADSGSVQPVNRDPFSGRFSSVVATISFSAPHATRQHEDISLRHPHGGGPKFLTRAADEFSNARGLNIVAGVVQGKLTGLIR